MPRTMSTSIEIVTPTVLTDGYTVGASATALVGFYGATPAAQPAAAAQAAVGTTASTTTTPTGYTTTTQADGIVTLVNRLRADMVTLGLIKGAA